MGRRSARYLLVHLVHACHTLILRKRLTSLEAAAIKFAKVLIDVVQKFAGRYGQ